MGLYGEQPDVFADLLRRYAGSQVEPDPIDWFLRTATRAVREAQAAANLDRHRRVARSTGHKTYYAHRDAWCRLHGYPSLWAYRKAMGWT